MKVLTAAQMRKLDKRTTEQCSISSLQLMENAGEAIVAFLRERIAGLSRRKIVVLCGKGNNGGDGLVIARLLKAEGGSPQVILFSHLDGLQGDAAVNLRRWQDESGEVHDVTTKEEWEAHRAALDAAELIIDALLGTGLRGPVEGVLAAVITDVNAVRAARRGVTTVVAVDMPSGLASDGQDLEGPAILADFTVTLTTPKVSQLVSSRASNCGTLIVRSIGTPPELLEADSSITLHWLDPSEFRKLPLARNPVSNKGTYGHALIVAGAMGKSGAAVLAARSSMRSGAGLVTVATPLDALPIVAAGLPEIMTAPLICTSEGTASAMNSNSESFHSVASGKSVMAIGPGMSTHAETQEFIRSVVATTELPLIIDADGLNAFAECADKLKEHRTPAMAITPHPGEMARLIGTTVKAVQERRLEIALETAARWQVHVILKGFHTVLATPSGHAYINTTGNPGMATGGTGDALTGILAGLTAQFGISDWTRILGLGIYLHGLAGDLAAMRVGEAPLIASDLIEAIPEAYSQILADWKHAE